MVSIQSCADTSEQCRDMISENFLARHMFSDMGDQFSDKPCLRHSSECGAFGCKCMDVDLAIVGTVCAPYSTQRAKRFAVGSVKQHCNHDLTAEVSVE